MKPFLALVANARSQAPTPLIRLSSRHAKGPSTTVRRTSPPRPACQRAALHSAHVSKRDGRRPPALGFDRGALTARELEVFTEMAAGSTNREIAQRLHLSETTIKTHVVRILAKLGLRDRTQAVIFAYEHGIRRPRS